MAHLAWAPLNNQGRNEDLDDVLPFRSGTALTPSAVHLEHGTLEHGTWAKDIYEGLTQPLFAVVETDTINLDTSISSPRGKLELPPTSNSRWRWHPELFTLWTVLMFILSFILGGGVLWIGWVKGTCNYINAWLCWVYYILVLFQGCSNPRIEVFWLSYIEEEINYLPTLEK